MSHYCLDIYNNYRYLDGKVYSQYFRRNDLVDLLRSYIYIAKNNIDAKLNSDKVFYNYQNLAKLKYYQKLKLNYRRL